MSVSIKVAGQWRNAIPKVKVAGAWRDLSQAYVKVGGQWRELLQAGGWDLTPYKYGEASYDGVSFSVTTEEIDPRDIHFKPDGTKIYITGIGSDAVQQYTLSTPWDITTTSYDSVSFSVAGQEPSPNNLFFKPDGTKMYVIGTNNDTVYQYTLSTPWDVSTASYDGVSFNVAPQDLIPFSILFKPDGTKMYMCGNANSSVYQYTLSTPWDVGTASYDSVSLDTTAQNTTPIGIDFMSNGTKIYVLIANDDTVYQYTLSTPWDVSTASYDGVSFNVGVQDTISYDIFFKPDGTKMYTVGSDNDSLYQYTLNAPWTLAGNSIEIYDHVRHTGNFYLGNEDSVPQSASFKPDGTKMYIAASSNDSVYQYTLSTAWDVSTTSYDGVSFSVAGQDSTPQDAIFKPDGTKMYVVGGSNDIIFQYTLSTPWDVSTTSYDSVSFDVTNEDTILNTIFFKPDGTKMYVLGGSNDSVYQYTLSTAWDISTASYDSVSFSIANEETAPNSLKFKNDGTAIYIMGTLSDTVYQYTLSTPWDISTASLKSSFPVNSYSTVPRGLSINNNNLYIISGNDDTIYQFDLSIAWEIKKNYNFDVSGQEAGSVALYFKSDGTKLYTVGSTTGDAIYQYTVSTPWDVSSASYDNVTLDISGQDTTPGDIFFKPDGTKMYMVGGASDSIYQYTLSTPWNLSTASYDSVSFNVGGQDSSPEGLYFKPDGTKLYMVGTSSDTIYQYTLSTPWNLSTASYDSVSFDVSGQETFLQGIFFKDDGIKMFTTGGSVIYQYTLSTPWDLNTTSYDNVSFDVSEQDGNTQGLYFKPDGTKMYTIGSGNNTVHQYTLIDVEE